MSNSKTPLVDRFGPDASDVEFGGDAASLLSQLAARGSVRKFHPDAIPYPTLRRLCALALCAPTKSDLQQRDIVIIDAPPLKSQIGALLADGPLGQKWLADVPNLLLFCGNNRRQRRIHTLRDRPFANDHLDPHPLRRAVAAPETSRPCFSGSGTRRGISCRSAAAQHAAAAVGNRASQRVCGRRPRRCHRGLRSAPRGRATLRGST